MSLLAPPESVPTNASAANKDGTAILEFRMTLKIPRPPYSPVLLSNPRKCAFVLEGRNRFAHRKFCLVDCFIPLTGCAGVQLVRSCLRAGHTPALIAAVAAPKSCKCRAQCQTVAAAAPKIQAPSQAAAPRARVEIAPMPRAGAAGRESSATITFFSGNQVSTRISLDSVASGSASEITGAFAG